MLSRDEIYLSLNLNYIYTSIVFIYRCSSKLKNTKYVYYENVNNQKILT